MKELTLTYKELQEEAQKYGANFVNASFEKLGTIPRVLVKIPSAGDRHFIWVQKHKAMVLDHEEMKKGKNMAILLEIPDHMKKDEFIDGNFISRAFCGLTPDQYGKLVVMNVTVQIKHDRYRKTKSIALWIEPSKNFNPIYKMKLGTPKEHQISFPIPGTEKFIGFEEI